MVYTSWHCRGTKKLPRVWLCHTLIVDLWIVTSNSYYYDHWSLVMTSMVWIFMNYMLNSSTCYVFYFISIGGILHHITTLFNMFRDRLVILSSIWPDWVNSSQAIILLIWRLRGTVSRLSSPFRELALNVCLQCLSSKCFIVLVKYVE